MQVGDLVSLKEKWRIGCVYYGIGVITLVSEGNYDDADGTEAWKSFRVQWNDDFSFHEEEQLELINESWRPDKSD